MLAILANSFRVPEIRKKLAFTAGMLLLYRIGAYIPAPGINVDAVEAISENFSGSNVLGFLNLFSGGSLQRFAIFALGIMPYITASIILQLMTVVMPSLEKLRKEGEVGQQKITQYTRYLTVGLAFGQSVGYVFLFRSMSAPARTQVVENFTFGRVFLIVTCLTAGCVMIMWFGELITQRGIGNGISLMIFASIVAGLPNGISAWWTNPDQIFKVMMPFLALAIIAAIVFMQEGQRRIPGPVREARGRPPDGRRRLHLPAAAREHGRRHPGDLRRVADGVPADDRRARRRRAGRRTSRRSSRRTGPPTWSASPSSSSCSPTSTPRSRSTRWSRRTTSRSTAASYRG